jgi:D-alanyl-D-alanine carboxypeptidase/D-alanyl-D-alanine-endopeptidase (penicillin-binding protein 4)
MHRRLRRSPSAGDGSRSKRRWAFWALVLCIVALPASGVALARPSDPAIRAINRMLDKPRYSHSEWGMLEAEPRTGQKTRALQAKKMLVPGSLAKLFVVSAAWNVLGPDHRFVTPVYALGQRSGSTLDGNLVLRASGDLVMGGRAKANGSVAYTNVDHTYADDVPGAELTPQDPLAGLDEIAREVRAAGLTHIAGDVVIDNRLWKPDENLTGEDPGTNPILINENVIDVRLRPTRPGEPAKLYWRPQTAAIRVKSRVVTAKSSKQRSAYPYHWHLDPNESGDRVVARGRIPANAGTQLLVAPIGDPASFARTALIEALNRAGVTVSAPTVDGNHRKALPPRDSYQPTDRVAAYRSPPYRQYARLILKVSHNVGAQVSLCLLAVDDGSRNCQRGFHVEREFLKRAGVNLNQVALADGRGGNPYDRATPRAMVQLLRWWTKRSDFRKFKRSLPILGVDGDLALAGRHSPARGKVFAKTGAAAGPSYVNHRLLMAGKAMAGYLAGEHGARPFALFMNNAFFPNDAANIFVASADLARVATVMQQNEPK